MRVLGEIKTQKFNKQRLLRGNKSKRFEKKRKKKQLYTLSGTFQNAYTKTNFFIFHSKLGCGPRIRLQGKLPTFAELSQ